MVSINENSLTTVGGYLTQIQAKLAEANSLDINSVQYTEVVDDINDIENQMSSFLGALFHKNELDVLVQEQSQQAVELVIDQVKRETVDNFLLQAKLAMNTSSLVAKVELNSINAAE